jgi:hypothetical protein
MESRQRSGEFSTSTNGSFNQLHYTGVPQVEKADEKIEEFYEASSLEGIRHGQSSDIPRTGEGSIAYELLLLQQRLAAYEQLHIEEMAELRQEVERLRRAFLQETNPHLRVLSSKRHPHGQDGE